MYSVSRLTGHVPAVSGILRGHMHLSRSEHNLASKYGDPVTQCSSVIFHDKFFNSMLFSSGLMDCNNSLLATNILGILSDRMRD